MLEFITGRAGTGKTRTCIHAMRDKILQEPMGPALVLLVPEHMTYKLERQLAAALEANGAGFMRGYVFGFRRFAGQVLLETGGAVYPRITDMGKRLLLKKVLDNRQPELQVFARAARQRGFTESLSSSIEEFKSYGVRADMLQDTAAQLGEGQLQRKLADLSLLYGDFAEAMKGRYNASEDMLDTLAGRLPQAGILQDAEVWIDGFAFFNPQEKQILRVLLAHADVHVTLSLDIADKKECVPETGLFHRSYETMQELRAIAAELGAACQVRSLQEPQRFRQESLAVIEKGLFGYPVPHSKTIEGVRLVEAANRRLEAEAAAADILRLCREQGYRWRDIGILIREEEAYSSVLDQVLRDYGIPFFSDSKRPGIHHPLAELVRSAFEVLHGWRYEPIFRCIRTEFFPVTRGQADQLENYVLQFGIRGRRWTMEEDWSWRRRLSLEEEAEQDDKDKAQLAEINLSRRQIVEPLQHFAQAVQAADGSVRGLTEAIYHLLMELQVTEKLARWSADAEKEGRLDAAREHLQIWEDVLSLLEQLVETSGEEKLKLSEFEGILGDGLDALKLSLIPPGLDYVTLASFDQNSLDNVRAIYVLGANEGVMPRRTTEQGLLSDADRLHLKEVGLVLPFGSIENSFAEKYLLYKGMTQARDYLWISYALADTEGKGQAPSPLIGRLLAMLPGLELLSIPLESLGRRDELLLTGGRMAAAGLASALRGYREHQELPAVWRDVYNWALEEPSMQPLLEKVLQGLFAAAGEDRLPPALARRLYTRNRCLRGSVTKLETFNSCPFSFYAQYGLHLRERTEYRFQAMDLGTLLHAVLCAFGERMKKAQRAWSSVTPEECHVICQEILQELAPRLQNEILLSTAQYQNLLERILKAAEKTIGRLSSFDSVSSFHPFVFEQAFGYGPKSLPPLVYALDDEIRLEIIGRIDRIDTAETEQGSMFLVLDYKTGNAYLNLWEIYYGLNLQLLTYLMVAEAGLAMLRGAPAAFAGMLYCFMRSKLIDTDCAVSAEQAQELLRKELRMPGWVVADPAIIRSIDASAKFIKVTLNKDGSPRSGSSIRTPEEFDVLLDYMAARLKRTGTDILSGEAAARPYRMSSSNACTYCKYHAVCGFDLQIPGFAYEEMPKAGKPEEALAAMKQETEEEGMHHAMVRGTAQSH